MNYDTNRTQTKITPELLDSLSTEVRTELIDTIESIQFIQEIIKVDRKYAYQVEKDEDGKVIVDISTPHILENMDYFREPALHFQKFGKYTNLHPTSAPNSSYVKYWKEEARRCREGHIRPTDGEWITGDHYFYLNFAPILLSKIIVGQKRADRVRDFPWVYDGDYMFFHYALQSKNAGQHGNVLKKRGSGFSFKGGAGLGKVFILGEGGEAIEEVKAFVFANEKEYLVKDGVLNKFVDTVDWCATHTPWPRIRELKDSMNEMHWTMGYKESNTGINQGTKNEIIGVTLQGDPEKARGKRGVRIYWEESGKFPNLLKAWRIAKPSVESDDYAFGTMIAYGTGGTEDANFKGAEELFYNPKGYNIYSIPNKYDRNVGADSRCTFFFPEYLNRLNAFDNNGNSDIIKALIETIKSRVIIKYGASDPNALVQEMAEKPITPQEAIMRREGSIFPVADLKEYLSEIAPSMQKFLKPHYTGRLSLSNSGDIKWSNLEEHPVIREYPIKDVRDLTGSVEIYRMPHMTTDGKVPRGRYIGGIDPVDFDLEIGLHSLGSIFIFDSWLDQIVAEYTGRPRLASAFYETSLRLLKFYNAEANYENNLKGLFAYFDNKHALRYLADTPEILKDLELVKGTLFGNRAKGTNATKPINSWARKLQADWLVSQWNNPLPVDLTDEQGKAIEQPTFLNLQKVRSVGYVKELIGWNPEDNYDRISAMGMVMILREDRLKYESKRLQSKVLTAKDDDWFGRFGGFGTPKYKKASKDTFML